MANSWNIPDWLEQEVRFRDQSCVYCGNKFTAASISVKSSASWEHIINDAKIITRENTALCCRGCNASKGQKVLSEWLQSKYCKERGITVDSVAYIVKQALRKEPKKLPQHICIIPPHHEQSRRKISRIADFDARRAG